MITIDVSLIRKTIIEAVDAAVTKIKREKRKGVTSLGVDLDFRFGRLLIAINDDDDESFRCPYFENFKDREWGFAMFDESTILEDRLDGLDSDEDDPQIRIVDGDEEERVQTLEDVCRWLFPKCIEWITSWFNEQPTSRWRPIWLRVDEETVGQGEAVQIEQNQKIPRAKKVKKEPLRLSGFAPPNRGIKIFKLGMREREYVDLCSENFDSAPRFVGQPLADKYAESILVKTNPPLVRRGDLATYQCGLTYLNSGRHAAALIDYFGNDPNFERIPLFDGEQKWTAVHPLKPVSVLDQGRTEFDWNHEKKAFEGVRLCEFDADALRKIGRSVFKIQESPFQGPFFLEDENSPGFLHLCEKMGLRGVQFELIWCEDLSEILPKFEEFMDRIKAFVKRLTGSCSITKMENTPRLSGIHKTFWRLGAFRELLKESGAERALTTFPEIASVIRSLSSVAPSRYSALDDPFSKKVISEVEQRFSGKEILEEVRGRLCLHLPKALALLKDLEAPRI